MLHKIRMMQSRYFKASPKDLLFQISSENSHSVKWLAVSQTRNEELFPTTVAKLFSTNLSKSEEANFPNKCKTKHEQHSQVVYLAWNCLTDKFLAILSAVCQ